MNLHREAVVVINNMVPNLGCDSFIYLHLLVLICNIIMHFCSMFCFVDANNVFLKASGLSLSSKMCISQGNNDNCQLNSLLAQKQQLWTHRLWQPLCLSAACAMTPRAYSLISISQYALVLKKQVHPKITILSFTHPHFVPKLYDFLWLWTFFLTWINICTYKNLCQY